MARSAPPLHSTLKSGFMTPRIDAYVHRTVYHYINTCLCTYHQHYFSSLFREAQQLNGRYMCWHHYQSVNMLTRPSLTSRQIGPTYANYSSNQLPYQTAKRMTPAENGIYQRPPIASSHLTLM